jgi:hypothetical protein
MSPLLAAAATAAARVDAATAVTAAALRAFSATPVLISLVYPLPAFLFIANTTAICVLAI